MSEGRGSEDSSSTLAALAGSSSSSSNSSEGATCDEAQRKRLREYLHRIVLIINFNNVDMAKDNAPFLRRLYGGVFDEIVIVSTQSVPDHNISSRGPQPFSYTWFNEYWALPRIFAQHPDAEGFLWSNDDVAMNYWTFLGADKTKLWLPNDPESGETRDFPLDDSGPPAKVSDSMYNTPEARRQMLQALEGLDPSYKEQFVKSNYPQKRRFQKRMCDLFYIPRRLVERFSFGVFPAFREARVPMEAAIPNMFYALEHPSAFDPVLDSMVYKWELYCDEERRRRYDPRTYWSKSIAALHPWKISKSAMRTKLVKSMADGDSCICHDLQAECLADS